MVDALRGHVVLLSRHLVARCAAADANPGHDPAHHVRVSSHPVGAHGGEVHRHDLGLYADRFPVAGDDLHEIRLPADLGAREKLDRWVLELARVARVLQQLLCTFGVVLGAVPDRIESVVQIGQREVAGRDP